MSYVDLISHYLTTFLERIEFDTSQTGMWLQGLFALYVINQFRAIKTLFRHVEKRQRDAVPRLNADQQFLSVTEQQMDSYRVTDQNYDVPKVFPSEFDKYVGTPSMTQLSQWILEVGSAKDTQTLLDIKRVITASAAIYGCRIPKILYFIDDRTKALWLRLKFDLELKEVDVYYIRDHLTSTDKNNQVDADKLRQIQRELPKVGALILQYSEKGDFPCFSTFLRILTGYRDLSKEKVLTPSVVQSLVTTYAEKSGFKIPASYIQCDLLTLQLIDAKCPETVTE